MNDYSRWKILSLIATLSAASLIALVQIACRSPRAPVPASAAASSPDSVGPYGWPILISTLPILDTSKVVSLPSGRRLFRTAISLRFKPGLSDSAKAEFFRRHSMQVIGLTRSSQFFVRVPDPGPPAENLFRLLDNVRKQPEIENAVSLLRDPLSPSP